MRMGLTAFEVQEYVGMSTQLTNDSVFSAASINVSFHSLTDCSVVQ